MLRYYTYYSVGGYKNLYLGSDSDKVDKVYYLPLLPVLEEEAAGDPESKRQFETLNALPKICQLSDKNSYGFPSAGILLFSHAGYKIICRHITGSTYALALRDITCGAKDEMGRSIPFLIIITGDTSDDARKLDILAAYFASYLKDTEQTIASLIGYDIEANGLCFKLGEFNTWIAGILRGDHSVKVVTKEGVLRVESARGCVALLCLPGGISEAYTAKEQHIDGYKINSVTMSDVISKSDVEQIINQLETVTAERDRAKASCGMMKKVAAGFGVVGFVLGLILNMKSCSGH